MRIEPFRSRRANVCEERLALDQGLWQGAQVVLDVLWQVQPRRLVVVPANRRAAPLPQGPHDLRVPLPAVDHVSQAEDSIAALSLEVGQGALQPREVAVNVREDRHPLVQEAAPTPGLNERRQALRSWEARRLLLRCEDAPALGQLREGLGLETSRLQRAQQPSPSPRQFLWISLLARHYFACAFGLQSHVRYFSVGLPLRKAAVLGST